jgi:glycosyltransferase involved in cell wall biosynthesis
MPGNHEWMASFAEHTPDIFALSHFLHATDFPRFLNYLIQSRGTQTVLVSNSELGYALTPFLRAYNPDTVFMDYIHMEEEYWKNGGYPQRSVEYQNQLDYTVVSSQHLKDWMVARGGDASRIEVCYTNIDANTWSPNSSVRERTRQELGIADSTSVLLYAGRIVEQKQPRVFAETIAHLSRRNLDFVALVAGEGGDLAWLQSFVTEHNIAHHVQFLGAVSNDRIKELLNAADIFFLPSKMEGISLAIYEAMSMGVVPVGANVGGQRELVIPSCGILIERSNPTTEAQEYAAHLDTLIRDTERTRRMGAMCRERILAEFRLDSMGEQMMCCLAHARAMADHNPRQSIDLKLANTLAANAIESVRSEQVLEYLWHQHYSGKTHFNNQSPQFLEQITKRHVLQWFAHRVRRYVRRKAQ